MAIQHNTILSLPDVRIKGTFSAPVTGVSIDTRTLNAGDLFVAFSGAQVDGHDFIPNAISRGASAVMASTFWDGWETWEHTIPLIITPDPVRSLADLAGMHRKRFDIPIIAITGTNGKTTTKNLLAHLLRQKYRVLSTSGNFNNHIGLPITILGLDEHHEIAVMEMGASKRGDIEYLCNIAAPEQGLITNISLAHTEYFQDIETIQATKGELFDYLSTHGGQIYFNSDDDRVLQLVKDPSDHFSFGFKHKADTSFKLAGPDRTGCYNLYFEDFKTHLPQAGKAFALNAAAAVTIALHNGFQSAEISQALSTYAGEPGRMQHLSVKDVHFYHDAYNANPASTAAGLETMSAIPSQGRKILIFADMLELGEQSGMLHHAVAALIRNAGFDFVILYGLEVMATLQGLEELNFTSFYHNVDKSAAIQRFLREVSPGDLVYLKGSRGMQLEDFMDAFKENN